MRCRAILLRSWVLSRRMRTLMVPTPPRPTFSLRTLGIRIISLLCTLSFVLVVPVAHSFSQRRPRMPDWAPPDGHGRCKDGPLERQGQVQSTFPPVVIPQIKLNPSSSRKRETRTTYRPTNPSPTSRAEARKTSTSRLQIRPPLPPRLPPSPSPTLRCRFILLALLNLFNIRLGGLLCLKTGSVKALALVMLLWRISPCPRLLYMGTGSPFRRRLSHLALHHCLVFHLHLSWSIQPGYPSRPRLDE